MFVDRQDAGARLATRLGHLRGESPVVLGLPRGGVPVAAEVARALDAPLDVILVRKLGLPYQPELAMGAIGEGGVRVINDDVVSMSGVRPADIEAVEVRERAELERRGRLYRGGRSRLDLRGRLVVIVDDGIATGSTAKAACAVARAAGARRIVLATPVAPDDWTRRLAGAADELIAVDTPSVFFGVGQFYRQFAQTSDDEVTACLERAAAAERRRLGDDPGPAHRDVDVRLGRGVILQGHLAVPARPTGLVLFAHGSGSSRHSPRNRQVAAALRGEGLATLLFDLLTVEEEHDRTRVFDIELLAARLGEVTSWARKEAEVVGLPVGYFGASTGAAAALWAAADDPTIAAVVSRGGRPDLAGERLERVVAPTLLIVGGRDDVVLGLNEDARRRLRCPSDLQIVAGATHLFEEPGALAMVATLAAEWFTRHLTAEPQG